MRAVVFPEAGAVEVREVPEPGCGQGEVVIRVDRAGVCGTDVHIWRGEYLSSFPLVPGHELCGRVERVGPGVEGLAVGDRVVADPNLDCGHCTFCRRQQNNHCLNWRGIGITQAGAFAELVAAPARAVYRLPEGISDAQGALIEPLSCVVHALERLGAVRGEEVLLFGAGPIGLLLMQALRHGGAGPMAVVEKQPARRELALRLGAAAALEPGDGLDAALRGIAPHGFPVVIDATGVAAVVERAIGYLRPCGRYLQFGVTPTDAAVTLRPFDLFKHDWTLVGSFALCYDFERAIGLLGAGVIEVEPLIGPVVPMDGFAEAFAAFVRGETLKVHVQPGAGG